MAGPSKKCGCLLGICLFFGGSIYLSFLAIKTTQATPALSQIKTRFVYPSATPSIYSSATPTENIAQHPGECHGKMVNYETGIASPEWLPDGYATSSWETSIAQVQDQTRACWVEMPVLLFQASPSSTTITHGGSTPGLAAFGAGITAAHQSRLHVFITFLLSVGGSGNWAGSVNLATNQEQSLWFASYFQAIQPFLRIAQNDHVEQVAIGTEEQWLIYHAANALWINLLQKTRAIYSGKLTYDANFDTFWNGIMPWMKSSLLSFFSIDSYAPVINTPRHVAPENIPALWKATVKGELDTFSREIGSPILISEIGYRQASDALYQPWSQNITTQKDPEEQAAACGAVLQDTLNDPHILGTFFWGWQGANGMNLQGTPAAQTIQKYYANI